MTRVLLALALTLSGCDNAPRLEQLCQADIKSRLINPETAEFFEFEPIESSQAERLWFEWSLQGRGVKQSDAWRYGGAVDEFKAVAKKIIDEFKAEGAEFRSYRVKADSRVGMTGTSHHVCAASENECGCFSEETFQR